jgi:AraC-like DNA-binding protein
MKLHELNGVNIVGPAAASSRQGHSTLIAPRLSLGSCVRAFVARSTVGCDLEPDQRFNHLPASPACAVTWFFSGSAVWAQDGTPAARLALCGPRTKPATSVNAGPVETLTMLIMPDALHALTGFQPAGLVDRSCDAADVFTPQWLAMLNAVFGAPHLADRVRLIEDFLETRWRAVPAERWSSARTYRNWAEGLALRALVSGAGRSVRQTNRRIRLWAGLPLASLMGLSRAEQALVDAQIAHAQGRVQWAGVAADAGYADQPHLCREARRVTGLSPQQLMDRIEGDECFWIYRLWR